MKIFLLPLCRPGFAYSPHLIKQPFFSYPSSFAEAKIHGFSSVLLNVFLRRLGSALDKLPKEELLGTRKSNCLRNR